jgi:hypothetical protein
MYVRPSDSENFQSWPSTKQKLAQRALKIRNCSFIQSESVVFRTDFCKTEFLAWCEVWNRQTAGPDLKTVRLGLNGGASELCMRVGDVRPVCLPSAAGRNRKRNVWTWNGSSLVEGTGTWRDRWSKILHARSNVHTVSWGKSLFWKDVRVQSQTPVRVRSAVKLFLSVPVLKKAEEM